MHMTRRYDENGASRPALGRNIDELIKRQATGGLAAAGLFPDPKPGVHLSVHPAGPLKRLDQARACTRNFLFMHKIGRRFNPIQAFAQEDSSRPHLNGRIWISVKDSWHRRPLQLVACGSALWKITRFN